MTSERCSTGISGLDAILNGGLVEGRNTLLRGPPGSGKTIFGLHFLADGVENGETSLYVNLGESNEYVEETAEHFGLHPDGVEFYDLSPAQDQFAGEESYSVFPSAEVEQPGFVDGLREAIEETDPDRVLLDPITEFRYLTADEHQFRTQILSFLEFLKEQGATVVLTSQASASVSDDDLQFLTDAVVTLDARSDCRTVAVSKVRGSSFQRGEHTYEISDAGVEVWPTLSPGTGRLESDPGRLSSGIPELDQLLGGGLDRGTVTVLSGPTGVGKTTTGVQFLREAAESGDNPVLYSFEESARTLLQRTDAIGVPLRGLLERGALSVVEIPPDEYTVGQFANMVRTAVEDGGTEFVMVDGSQGFKQNLRGLEDDPARDLLRVGRYLRSKEVSTIVVNQVHDITGQFRVTEEGVSNLADNIVFLRHVEFKGRIRKVIGTLKMRTSDFERNLREVEITDDGLVVGAPLSHLRGILTGTPEWSESEVEPTELDERLDDRGG